jgi:hypothetical protein
MKSIIDLDSMAVIFGVRQDKGRPQEDAFYSFWHGDDLADLS